MNKEDKNLLKHILSLKTTSYQEDEVQRFIKRHCKNNGLVHESDKVGNIYITKGTADHFPCVVAHMDTVHDLTPNKYIFENKGVLYAFTVNGVKGELDQIGTGGDDLVGVFFALKMVEIFDNIKCAFFIAEEVGCKGSSQADPAFFEDVGYMLQADRRGNDEVIINGYMGDMASQEFMKTVKDVVIGNGYYYSEMGSYTDVLELQDKFSISAFNLAAGYYNAHTDYETVNVLDVERTLKLGEDIIRQAGEQLYTCESTGGGRYGGYGSYGNFSSGYSLYDDYPESYWWEENEEEADRLMRARAKKEVGAPWWESLDVYKDDDGDEFVVVNGSEGKSFKYYLEDIEEHYADMLEEKFWEIKYGWPQQKPEKKQRYCTDCNALVDESSDSQFCESCKAYYEQNVF